MKNNFKVFLITVLSVGAISTTNVHAANNALTGVDGVTNADGSETDSSHINNDDTVKTGVSKSGIAFNNGALSILSVPNFDFGIQTIDGKTNYYKLNKESSNRELIVKDASGDNAGWTVNVGYFTDKKYDLNNNLVSDSAFNDDVMKMYINPSTDLTDSDGTVVSRDDVDGPEGGTYKNNTWKSDSSISTSGVKAYHADELGNEDLGYDSKEIMDGAAGSSAGTWRLGFSKQGTSFINVPYNRQEANSKYVITLEWVLSTGTK